MPWQVVPALAVLMIAVDAFVAPMFVLMPMAKGFSEHMSGFIIGLEAAASMVDFADKARVILAFDRALLPLWLLILVCCNLRLIRFNVKVNPMIGILFFGAGSIFLVYVYFNPLIPDPDSASRAQQAGYLLISNGPLGFSIFHGFFSWALVISIVGFINLVVRYKMLIFAHNEWNQGRWEK